MTQLHLNISRLSAHIETIQQKINHVNRITDDAISQLESQKRGLRSTTHPQYPVLEKNIQDITLGHDKIVEKLLHDQTNIRGRKASLDQLDYTVCQLDREISRLQSERDRSIFELNKKRDELLNALKSTESAFLQISELDNQIEMLMAHHQAELEKLLTEKTAVMDRKDLSEQEKEMKLAELERKIKDESDAYSDYMSSLERQKIESLSLLTEYTEEECKALQNTLKAEIDVLEAMKIGASPSEIESLNKKINELNIRLDDIELIDQLRDRNLTLSPSGRIITASGQIFTMEEAAANGLLDGMNIKKLLLRDKLKEKGLTITKSGRLITKSGRIIPLEDAKELGIGDSIMQTIQTFGTKKSSLSATSETISDMSSEDVTYLKTTVGKPLTLALAEICRKQPRDPIHYLGHWLFKYRYNQEIDEVKKREIADLTTERERIRLENWHKEVEDAARTAVLDMIFKAHDEAMHNELEAEGFTGSEGAEENDELAEEAKDVLGEYNGPPAGQRRI